MTELLTPKLDYVFKKLFTQNKELLIDLINSVTGFNPNEYIKTIQVKNPEILAEHIKEKYIILDINASDNKGHLYNIEMQVSKYRFYPKRSAYYLSKLYAGQLTKGADYQLLEPVLGIHFLDYIEYEDYPDYYFQFEFREKKYHELRYVDDLSLHIFELPKVTREIKVNQEERKRFEWLDFLNHAHEGGYKMQLASYTNPKINEAYEILRILSADPNIREQAELREKALRNRSSELWAAEFTGEERGIKKGKLEGEQNKAFQMARILKQDGVNIISISKASGLSTEQIKQL